MTQEAKKTARKICYDKILPKDLHRPHRKIKLSNGRFAAIAVTEKRWINGSTIKIRFLNGSQQQIDMVKQIAPEWTLHANLKFEFTDDINAEIRVAFDQDDGAWSYVGIDNQERPNPLPTLNLGWVDKDVILHEFGHMIGLSHEHQNPDQGINWNEQVVINELAGPPNYWTPDETRHNVLNKYSVDVINGTEFDLNSIMLYAFPAEWTTDGFSTHANNILSPIDKDFIRSKKMYPSMDPVEQRAILLKLGKSINAQITRVDQEDLYKLIVEESGIYTIQTFGPSNIFMRLYGPDSPTKLITKNDDSGTGLNPLIEAALQPGKYYIQITHRFDKTGEYKILAFG